MIYFVVNKNKLIDLTHYKLIIKENLVNFNVDLNKHKMVGKKLEFYKINYVIGEQNITESKIKINNINKNYQKFHNLNKQFNK
jgi:hypothetical protein